MTLSGMWLRDYRREMTRSDDESRERLVMQKKNADQRNLTILLNVWQLQHHFIFPHSHGFLIYACFVVSVIALFFYLRVVMQYTLSLMTCPTSYGSVYNFKTWVVARTEVHHYLKIDIFISATLIQGFSRAHTRLLERHAFDDFQIRSADKIA